MTRAAIGTFKGCCRCPPPNKGPYSFVLTYKFFENVTESLVGPLSVWGWQFPFAGNSGSATGSIRITLVNKGVKSVYTTYCCYGLFCRFRWVYQLYCGVGWVQPQSFRTSFTHIWNRGKLELTRLAAALCYHGGLPDTTIFRAAGLFFSHSKTWA